MEIINRSAIVVSPREPYLSWAAGLEANSASPATTLRGRVSVYLVESAETPREEFFALKRHYRAIFETELATWSRDASDWPPKRDFTTFRAWFSTEVQSVVVDLADGTIDPEL